MLTEVMLVVLACLLPLSWQGHVVMLVAHPEHHHQMFAANLLCLLPACMCRQPFQPAACLDCPLQ